MMRSLTPPRVMNGTRCIVINASPNTVIVQIASGAHKGEIHCMSLQPSDTALPFSFTRGRFPFQPCLTLTINKAQAQTMKYIGLYLAPPGFFSPWDVVCSIIQNWKQEIYMDIST